LFGRAKTEGLGQVTMEKNVEEEEEHGRQETPQGHWTPPFFSSSQGAKYIMVTQHTSPSRW